jgi:uncharacterized protein with PIN domain
VIAGAVLDTSAIIAFGRGDPGAMLAIHQFDMKAQALLIPMTAMTEALVLLGTQHEAERALYLLEFGVAIDESLSRDNVRSVATAGVEAKAETTLGTAHAARAARERSWKVLTGDRDLWATAHPDVTAAGWAS